MENFLQPKPEKAERFAVWQGPDLPLLGVEECGKQKKCPHPLGTKTGPSDSQQGRNLTPQTLQN